LRGRFWLSRSRADRFCLNRRYWGYRRWDHWRQRIGSRRVLPPAFSIERFARFDDKAKQGMCIVSLCFGRVPAAGGCNGQYAKQVGVADLSIAAVNGDPDVRGQIAMKRAVPL
jgi:hypothetical protein